MLSSGGKSRASCTHIYIYMCVCCQDGRRVDISVTGDMVTTLPDGKLISCACVSACACVCELVSECVHACMCAYVCVCVCVSRQGETAGATLSRSTCFEVFIPSSASVHLLPGKVLRQKLQTTNSVSCWKCKTVNTHPLTLTHIPSLTRSRVPPLHAD